VKVRLPVLFAVAAFVLLAAVVARGTSGIPVGTREFGDDGFWTGGGQQVSHSDAALEPIAYGAILLIVLIGVMALFGLSGFFYVLIGFRLRRRRRQAVPKVLSTDALDPSASWVARATKRAMSEMDRRLGGPPSDAVIAAWVQLEEAAAAGGTGRAPHQTPSEFTETVLYQHNADAEALKDLRKLYHRARFGKPETVTPEDVTAARTALERIGMTS
jgi:hypothetical protein